MPRVVHNPDRLGFLVQRPFAHRGLHDESRGIVENTAQAFERAIAARCAIECDIVLTKDGQAAVFHDDRLERLTTGQGRVDAHTLKELKAIPFREPSATGFLTLPELTKLVDGATPLLVELKSYWNGDVRLAEEAVRHLRDYPGPLAVMSFDPVLLGHVTETAPEMVRGLVACPFTHDFWRARMPAPLRIALQRMTHLDRTQPEFISFDVDGLPAWQAALFRRSGLPVLCWTVRDMAAARRGRAYADQITFEGLDPDSIAP